MDCFQISGNLPCSNDRLNIHDSGPAKTSTQLRYTAAGTPSGPGENAFFSFLVASDTICGVTSNVPMSTKSAGTEAAAASASRAVADFVANTEAKWLANNLQPSDNDVASTLFRKTLLGMLGFFSFGIDKVPKTFGIPTDVGLGA